MKKFNSVFVTVILGLVMIVAVSNIVLYQKLNTEKNEAYTVVLNRIEQEVRLLEKDKNGPVTDIAELSEVKNDFGIKIVNLESLDIESSNGENVAKCDTQLTSNSGACCASAAFFCNATNQRNPAPSVKPKPADGAEFRPSVTHSPKTDAASNLASDWIFNSVQ